MNTHGHEDVAKTAGLPLLEEAFGKDKRSLTALHLGNWLTDVSQAIDPVAYWSGSSKIKSEADSVVEEVKKSIEGFLDELIATVFDEQGSIGQQILKSLKPDIEPYAKKAKDSLHKKIDFLTASQSEERDARLAKFFRDSFLVTGYYKFVHPETSNDQPRMNFECFMRVFGRPTDTRGAPTLACGPDNDRPGAYTQYYPHEHLDRPEILPPQEPPIYSPGKQIYGYPFRLADGKRSGTRSPRSKLKGPIEPDLYSYLRDHIEMTAGLLAEVDIAFQQAISKGIRDDDPKWHITLAKLGHALHQVEDFFAHSNWVELAATRLGPEVVSKFIPPETKVEVIDRAYTTFQKRLKRHLTESLPEWQKHPEETWAVTGFFDFWDTVISLAHITEELWGGDVPDPYAEGYQLLESVKEAATHPKTVKYEVQKAMRGALDFLTNPTKALEDDENEVAKSLKDKFESDINKLRRPGVSQAVAEQVARETTHLHQAVAEQVARETTHLHGAPKEVRDAFFNVIVEGSRVYTFGKQAFTIYETVQEIAEFIKNPLGWLGKWLSKEIKGKLIDALKFYARERFYDWIGAGRIGCHSLLAKDHGREPFYTPQKECATAVHWYIVKTLLRWKEKEDATPIDWLELLEYFLRNPLPPKDGSFREIRVPVSVTLVHTVKYKEQLKADDPRYSLEDLYRPRAINPKQFSWRMIADANFNTQGMPLKVAQNTINRILHDTAWGTDKGVTPPNYAFKPGMRILIPNQTAIAIFLMPTSDETTWFKEVFDKGWKVFRGLEDPESQTSQCPLEHHKPVTISLDEVDRIILKGRKLRREAREAYRPPVREAVTP
ncbi:MAG: HET-C-related protein [Nitrospirota bacterium]